MSNAIRLQADFDRLRALAAASGEMIAMPGQPTTAAGQLDLELRYATARSERYPADVTRQTRVRVVIELPQCLRDPGSSGLRFLHAKTIRVIAKHVKPIRVGQRRATPARQ